VPSGADAIAPNIAEMQMKKDVKKTSQLTVAAKTAEKVARRYTSGQKVLH